MNKIILASFLLLLNFSCSSNRSPKPKNIITLNNPSLHVQVFEPGLVSSFLHERDFAVHPNGKIILFSRGSFDQKDRHIVQIRIYGDSAGLPLEVPFLSQFDDIEPFFHPNGKELYFASNRKLSPESTRKDYNIWKVTFDESTMEWGKAEPLPEIINTEVDEFYPSVSENGNLYFTAAYPNGLGKEDIFMSRFENGAFSKPEVLPSQINSGTYEFNAYISPNEDVLLFSSYGRADDLGGGDLYMSKKNAAGNWQEAIHLNEPINSSSIDYCPFVDWERQTFYFTSNRKKVKTEKVLLNHLQRNAVMPENGFGDIFRVHTDVLK